MNPPPMGSPAEPVRRPGVALGVAFALFLLAVGGAWGWFHLFPRSFASRLRLEPGAQVPGHAFTREPVTPAVLDMLAVSTNDLVSGFFEGPGGASRAPAPRFSVFYAGWSARSAREMGLVMHTPDVCWVGAGAVPVALGQPAWVELDLGGVAAPFECRVFELQPGRRELTLWCTLVNGQVYSDSYRFVPAAPAPTGGPTGAPGMGTDLARVAAGRRVGGNQFLHAVRERVPGTGEKQFVRMSTRVDGTDWPRALERLRDFGRAWLTLTASPGPGPH